MKFLRLLLLTLILINADKAFTREIYYSPYEKFEFRGGDFSVVGKSGGRLYVYRGSNEGFYLDAYDEKMERLATIVLDFFPRKIYETRFIPYNDKIVVLYQAIESGKVVQYAALLDNMGMLKKGPINIDAVKSGFWGPNRDYFSSAVSDDKTKIAIYAANKKNSSMDVHVVWMDDDLNKLNSSELQFEADNYMEYGDGMIANNGDFYMSVYTPTGSKNYTDQIWLLAAAPGAKSFNRHKLPLNEKYAAGTYMKLDNLNNRIYVGGFYSDKKNGNLEGVLYAYFDIAKQAYENRKNIAFDPMLRTATGERNKKKAMNNYQVRNLIVKNDGGFVMVAEDYYITTRNTFNPGLGYYSWYYPAMSSTIREYHYGDIVALSYDATGTKDWHTFVRKDQYSQEDGGIFSSYALVNTGGMIGFLFNDFNSSRSRIQLASLAADGSSNMVSLASNKSDDPDWLPRSGKQIASREVVVPCLRKRQICFVKVVL
jgi:hypothetical protein